MKDQPPNSRGMGLRWSGFRAAFTGLSYMILTQPHARWHLAATLAVAGLAAALKVTLLEWALLVLAMGLVWVAEAVNTAIELACDAITRERHPLIGLAKDLAAGAVLLAAFFAAVVGGLIFLPRMWC